jgi:NAD(P)-dependent dehydrogenase (short-subunit alcohol dehydrogenase family)
VDHYRASRGLGRAFTEAVLEAGDCVVATGRNPEQLVELQGRYSGKVRTVALDVTNEAHAKAAFEAAIASFGGLDVLVNNAGYGWDGSCGVAARNGSHDPDGGAQALAAPRSSQNQGGPGRPSRPFDNVDAKGAEIACERRSSLEEDPPRG